MAEKARKPPQRARLRNDELPKPHGKARGMGKGLAAILAASPKEEPEELRQLAVETIGPSPHQPRRHFDEQALSALAGSLSERGVLQPVLVRPVAGGFYELIAGERRWRAAQLAGLREIPAIVRRHDDAASLELAVIENMAREDLNPVEEARACAALVEELGLTREDVGRRVGRSRVAVSNLIRLLDLPDEALALMERGDLSEGHGRALLLARAHDARRRLARAAAAGGWSVRELERRARDVDAPRTARSRSTSARRVLHPDQEAAVEQLSDAFGAALGAEVTVTPSGDGYRLQLAFDSLAEALDLAHRLAATDLPERAYSAP
ncbi:MAG TPA: ParB/RepB/Spo0J family partition protein [Conexibacter sp.]|nr:ParB/RepB/Spo0J family partition protein [Conexibacter sp.]